MMPGESSSPAAESTRGRMPSMRPAAGLARGQLPEAALPADEIVAQLLGRDLGQHHIGMVGHSGHSTERYLPWWNSSGLIMGSWRMRMTRPTKITWSPPS